MDADLSFTIARHCVPSGPDRLSPLQQRILSDPAPVRVFSAPTGAGKSYALIRAAEAGKRVLFVVPTRRLAQNLAAEAAKALQSRARDGVNPVALWSSDETARRRELDPGFRPWQARVREVREFEKAQFIVSTPESVALMLLRAPSAGHGSDPFGVSHLTAYFDHIVFDEFHSIDARGFGLCAVAARACAATSTKVTFLSATPIDLLPVLMALGIEADQIAVGAETVLDNPDPAEEGLRALHGDVQVSFVAQPDMASLLVQHEHAIRECLQGGRQLVVIFDSLEELHVQKDRLAAVLDHLGVPAARRLAINSIDDSTRAAAALGGLFVTDRDADPVQYPVLVATSSVEMGVTFRAGMLVMDPGHDALSLVQRIGRVARGDEPGLVVVRLDPGRVSRLDWLRKLMADLRAAPDMPRLPVSRFLTIVLQAARERFAARDDLGSDDPPRTLRSMPHRAVWAACLFWHALEHGQKRHLSGQKAALRDLMPAKVGRIAARLRTLEDANGFASEWAQLFLEQAATLRNIAPTVAVKEPGGRTLGAVPMRLIHSRPALGAAPLLDDGKGGWILHLDRPLDAALREEVRVFRETTRTVLLPDGQTRTAPAKEAAETAIREMRKLLDAPGTTAREAECLEAATDLVRLSGLVPGEADAAVGEGSAVV